MRKEARLLRDRGIDSLVLAVEHFNRPWDRGRADAVLILLDHSMEMLLKASLLHRGGRIRERYAKQTLGFDACVRQAVDGPTGVRFLTREQAMTIQMINAQRDAAQHYLLEISEQQLYLHAQTGVTLYADILKSVFRVALLDFMPERVLPVSAKPLTDLGALMKGEVAHIRALLRPKKRMKVEAAARARALAIMEGSVQGERVQPTSSDLNAILKQIGRGKSWDRVFPGVAGLKLDPAGEGIPFSLRIQKQEGMPIHVVPEGTPNATVVALKRVNEIDFYSLGLNALSDKAKLSAPRALAVIQELGLQADLEYFKEFKIGRASFKRYSAKALDRVIKELPKLDLDDIWERRRPRHRA
jgi:uncharacterized protein DUF3644